MNEPSEEDDNTYAKEVGGAVTFFPIVPLGYPSILLVSLGDHNTRVSRGLVSQLLASDYYAEVLAKDRLF